MNISMPKPKGWMNLVWGLTPVVIIFEVALCLGAGLTVTILFNLAVVTILITVAWLVYFTERFLKGESWRSK
jgi:hypothetical protein